MRFLTRPKPGSDEASPSPEPFAIEKLPAWPILLDDLTQRISGTFSQLCGPLALAPISAEATSSQSIQSFYKGGIGAALAYEGCEAGSAILFDRACADYLVSALLGGRDDGPATVSPDSARSFTGVDFQLIQCLAQQAAMAINEAFAIAMQIDLTVERIGLVPEASLLGRRESVGLACRLRLKAPGASGSFALMLDHGLIQRLDLNLAQVGAEPQRELDPVWAHELSAELGGARVSVIGVLEQLDLTLGDVAQFEIGQVLELHRPGAGRVLLQSGGQSLFWCRLDQLDGVHTLEVTDAVESDRLSS